MKRLLAIALAAVILLSLTVTAYAETTRIFTTVPGTPTWTLSIPADVGIPYHMSEPYIGEVAVTDIYNPDYYQGYVDVYLSYENLRRTTGYDYNNDDYYYDDSCQIPFILQGQFEINDGWGSYYGAGAVWESGTRFSYGGDDYNPAPYGFEHFATFWDNETHPVMLYAQISSEAWDNAAPGQYATSLVFTSMFGDYYMY